MTGRRADLRRVRAAPTRLYVCRLLLASVVMTCANAAAARDVPSVMERILDHLDRVLARRCLSPVAGRALSDVVAAGAFQPVLGSEFTLAGGKLSGDRIELEVRDHAQHSYTITLALPGVKAGEADGRGERFLFYLGEMSPANSRAATALLAAAALCDGAIPDSAFERCAGGDESHGERRYSRARALTSAIAEVAIIVVAILFGLRAVRPSADRTRTDV